MKLSSCGLNGGALFNNYLLIAAQREGPGVPRLPAHIWYVYNRRAGVQRLLQRFGGVEGVKAPPRSVGYGTRTASEFLHGAGVFSMFKGVWKGNGTGCEEGALLVWVGAVVGGTPVQGAYYRDGRYGHYSSRQEGVHRLRHYGSCAWHI